MNKGNKGFFLLTFSAVVLFICLSTVSAWTANGSLVAPASSSNYSTTIPLLNCTTNVTNAMNATIWYNATGVANATLATAFNQTTGDTNFTNASVSISGLADGTYMFWCSITNITAVQSNTSINTGVIIDNTGPVVTIDLPNAGWNVGSIAFFANISDVTSNFTNSTNYWLEGSTGNSSVTSWTECEYTGATSGFNCSSTLVTTDFVDGNYTLWVSANDTVWVNGSGATYNVKNQSLTLLGIDNTNPSPTAACSPSTVDAGATFPCSCSATDTTSGVSTTSSSSTSGTTSNTVNTGTFTYTCTATDHAGNSASTTTTYSVTQSPSAGGGTSTTSFWTTGTTITTTDLETGYTQSLGAKHRIKFQFESETHHVGVVSVSAEKATIEIASDPVQVILSVGEDAKVDITGDGFYDIYVILNSILDGKANVTVKQIHEEIPEGEGEVGTGGEIVSGEAEKKLTWLWIIIGVVVLAIIIGGGKALRKKQ